MYYTGVGSRETPIHILILMVKISIILEAKGYILRSGAAHGADSAFDVGIQNPLNSEIFIPNKTFTKSMGTFNPKVNYIIPKENKILYYDANDLLMSKNLYKRWDKVSNQDVFDLHNRNIFQVLGQNLKTKSKFLICYTKCGSTTYAETHPDRTGGTGTAINVASVYNIPVFNLKLDADRERLEEFVEKNNKYIDYNVFNKIVLKTKLNKENKTISELINSLNFDSNLNLKNNFKSKIKC